MHSDVVAFAIPTQVCIEGDGARVSGYVTHFEGGCVWVYLRGGTDLSFRIPVRLIFSREGEASLGMAGVVLWASRNRVAVEVQHVVDLAIVRQWSRGEPADVSEFVRVERAELPTAEFSPIAALASAYPADQQPTIDGQPEWAPMLRELSLPVTVDETSSPQK